MRKKSNKKQEILKTSRKLIREMGYEAFRLDDLLETLQLSKGGFYHHFKSIDSLLSALITEDFQREIKLINTICKNDNSKEAILELLSLGPTLKNKGILKHLKSQKDRLLYLNLMDASWYSPFKHELTSLLNKGLQNNSFPNIKPNVVAELFEAINRQSNRCEILGLWDISLKSNYTAMALDLLSTTLGMEKDFLKLKKIEV